MSRLFVCDKDRLATTQRDPEDARHEAIWVNWYNNMFFVTLAGHGGLSDEQYGCLDDRETRVILDMYGAQPSVFQRVEELQCLIHELREAGLL